MGTQPFPSVVRRVVPRPAAFFLLTLACALAAPPSSQAAQAHHVLSYDLFTERLFGNNGEDIQAASAPDGWVLVIWTEWGVETWEQSTYGQWLAPGGTPSGETFRVARRAGVLKVAVETGRQAIVLVQSWEDSFSYVVTLRGERVTRRGTLPEPGCGRPLAATATGRGWFVACEHWRYPEPQRRIGWWLDPAGRARHEVEIGAGYELAAAGGVRDQVALVYRDSGGSPLLARWITPRRSGPVVVVDPATDVGLFAPVVTHLRDRVFALSWLAERESGSDDEGDAWRVTSVQEATFRAPGVVRAERRFSPPSAGLGPGPVSEHRTPFVLRAGDRQQLVGWFGCEYGGSPGGRLCYDREGLYLRARRDAGPAGGVIGLSLVSPYARVVYTGDLLLTATLVRKAFDEDRWSLRIQAWEIE